MLNSILVLLLTIVIAHSGFSNDKIVVPIQYLPLTLNPPLVNDTSGQFILNTIADGLIGWSYKEGIFPEIADSWSERTSGHVIFKIKENLRGYTGNAIKCKDIAATLKIYSSLRGPFQSSYEKIKKINCLNQIELEIESTMDTKTLLDFLASPQGKIITLNGGIITDGVGPYRLKLLNDSIQLIKNDYYYDEKNISIKEISLVVKSDAESLELYRDKKINLILLSNLSNAKIDFIPKEEIVAINLWTTWGIAFNQKISPFNDKELRHCLIHNTASQEWIKDFYPNDLPAYGPIPFGLVGYKKQVANYKKVFTKNIKNKVEIFIPKEIQNSTNVATWIKSNFSKCIEEKNIKVSIIGFNKMIKMFNRQKMGAYLMSFNKETISNESFFKSFYAEGKENFYNNVSSNTKLAFLALEKSNSEDIDKLSNVIAESLAEDAVMIPLMHPIHKVAIKNCIKNINLNPINEGYFNIKNIRNLCN